MNVTRNSEGVVVFGILPTEEIKLAAAISLDSEGRAHHLRAGEAFRGFAVESRNDDNVISAYVCVQGIEPLKVEGFTPADVGKTVYAEGPFSLTLNPKGNKSAIGFVVGPGGRDRAIVKFCSQKS